jgi:hypothetical protein
LLTGDEQKAAKTTAFDLQINPANPGMSFHKLDKGGTKISGRCVRAATSGSSRRSATTPIRRKSMTPSGACSMSRARARDDLLVTGLAPATEFLDDFSTGDSNS